MPRHNYSTWLTKQQAAEAIGVSTKLIERMAQERQIQHARWKRPTGGPRISVYHPDDVERVRKERNPEAAPFVLTPTTVSENSESPETALTHSRSENSENGAVLLANVLERISSQNSESRWPPPLFLTTEEAARYSGLSASYLQRLVAEGKLNRISEGLRGHRYRRADLDNLNP